MIPTSIDGTDITGATIDGTDVTEITVDGQTVFSAQNLPIAYSNLVAWYPFDSATYGGANTDDVTAIIGGSGNDTAANLTGTSTYNTSGGVTDINAGASSGYVDLIGSNKLDVSSSVLDINPPKTWTFWARDIANGFTNSGWGWFDSSSGGNSSGGICLNLNSSNVFVRTSTSSSDMDTLGLAQPNNNWNHYAIRVTSVGGGTFSGATFRNGILQDNSPSDSNFGTGFPDSSFLFLGQDRVGSDTDGEWEDVRCYNTDLSNSQINDIYENTKPAGHSQV